MQATLNFKHYAALLLLCLVFFLPGQHTLPPIDRDEARFAQATKQMLESGDYVDIKFQDEHRYKKPIGIYWLQAAAVKLTGAPLNEIWAYRLPSVAGASASVLLTAAIGTQLFNPVVGIGSAVLMASSLILNVEARLAKTDAMLLACIMAAILALVKIWQARTCLPRWALVFWLALAAGVLIKGPIIFIPIVSLLAAARWQDGDWQLLKNLRPAWGVPLLLLCILPWLAAITLKSGGAFWGASVGQDLLGKVVEGQDRGSIPPGYHLALFTGVFWPASILLLFALPFIWQHRKQEKILLLLAWVIPLWLIFELVPTKLPHYVLPTYPALAMLAMAALINNAGNLKRAWLARSVLGLWALVGIGFSAAFSGIIYATTGNVALLQLIAATLSLCVVVYFIAQRHVLTPLQQTLALALVGWLTIAPLFGHTLPNFSYIFPAQQVQRAIATQTDCPASALMSAQFNEPSLIFLNGTATVINADGMAAAGFLTEARCNFVLVDAANLPAFTTTADQLNIAPQLVTTINGFSFGGGDNINMQLFRLP